MVGPNTPQPCGPYVLVERLAAGGMAEVYLAKLRGDGGFEKPVAIKRVHAHSETNGDTHEALIAEAKLAVSLSHPNIVQTLDLCRMDRGTHFLVMEHVEGFDLNYVLERLRRIGRTFPLDLAAFVMAEVCSGLDHAHRRTDVEGRPAGIIHRDVSPGNILLSFAGEVKVADFGIAKTMLERGALKEQLVEGKYLYMSPEQAHAVSVDHRTDIFSAGVVLWELLAGRRLRQAPDFASLFRSVRRADVPPPSSVRAGVPRELDAIVARATASSPAKRYPDARSMANELRAFLEARPPTQPARDLGELLAELPALGSEVVELPPTRDGEPDVPLFDPSTVCRMPPRGAEAERNTLSGWRRPERGPLEAKWLMVAGSSLSFAWLLWWLLGA